MLAFILILVLAALGAYLALKAKTPDGWDWKKGVAALVALGAAIWAYASDFLSSVMPG
jgi:hypothetical protein